MSRDESSRPPDSRARRPPANWTSPKAPPRARVGGVAVLAVTRAREEARRIDRLHMQTRFSRSGAEDLAEPPGVLIRGRSECRRVRRPSSAGSSWLLHAWSGHVPAPVRVLQQKPSRSASCLVRRRPCRPRADAMPRHAGRADRATGAIEIRPLPVKPVQVDVGEAGRASGRARACIRRCSAPRRVPWARPLRSCRRGKVRALMPQLLVR